MIQQQLGGEPTPSTALIPLWPWPWPCPCPCPWPPPLLAAGDLHGAIVRRIVAVNRQANGDRHLVMQAHVAYLHTQRLVSNTDLSYLNRLLELLKGQPADIQELNRQVTALYDEFLDIRTGGPVAGAVLSITHDAARTAAAKEVIEKDVEGALAGAGAAFGLWGVVIGAIVGAGLSSAAAAL